MTVEEIDSEIRRVKMALEKTNSSHLRSDYGKYLKKLYQVRRRLKHDKAM